MKAGAKVVDGDRGREDRSSPVAARMRPSGTGRRRHRSGRLVARGKQTASGGRERRSLARRMAIWWRRASRGGGARAAADRQCPAAGSTGEWGRSEARASSGSCCSIPPDALVKTACVGRYMPWRPPWVSTRTPLAVASCGTQQCNNWQRCAMKTASALTVVKILVVHSRFPFANFHGHLGSP